MQTLVDYVVTRLGAGCSRADICEELVALGWSKGHAESAYRDALIALGAPMPASEKPMTTAPGATTGEIVANIFSFILLHIVIWSTVFLCFELCANFTFWSGLQTTEALKSQGWVSHTAGRNCKQQQVQWPAG